MNLKRRRVQRGAFMVEYALVLPIVLGTYFSFMQIVHAAVGQLVMKSATLAGARTAIVTLGKDKGTNPSVSPLQDADIRKAVLARMGPYASQFADVRVRVEDASSRNDPFGPVTVTVDAEFKCQVPMGNLIACKGKKSLLMTQSFTLPHQGANYVL